MLKIKDNIDMKVLEQYGFKKHEYIQDIDIEEWYEDHWVDENGNKTTAPPLDRSQVDRTSYQLETKNKYGASMLSAINVFADQYDKRREIINDEFDIEVLYDLIQDGLVEKV